MSGFGDPLKNGLPTAGATANPSTSFTRPADTTAYTSGDLVANSTTAGSVTPMTFANCARAQGGAFSVVRARLRKSGTGVTTAAFRLHLFSALPTVANGDNGVLSATQSATYVGAIDFAAPVLTGAGGNSFSDGAVFNGSPATGAAISVSLSSGADLYGLLEARGAYTPTSGETFSAALEILQD